MRHEQTLLASCKGLGSIFSCSCGQYHIHLPGMTVHLNEERFERLAQMVLQARGNQDLLRANGKDSPKVQLKLVKR